MLQKLLDLSENIECDINIYGKEFKDIRIEKGNPDPFDRNDFER